MGDISKNLSRHEFACQCGCGFDTVDYALVLVIQDAVDHFQEKYPDKKIRVRINSGSRCKAHNKAVGGGDKSQHLEAKAGDIVIYDALTGEDIPADEVADYFTIKYRASHGIGRYTNFTHIDVRQNMARWDFR